MNIANTPLFSAVLRRFAARSSLIHIVFGAMLATMGGYGINYLVAAYLTRHFGLDYAQAGWRLGLISSVPAALSIIAGGFVSDWAGRRAAYWYALIPALGSLLCAPFYIAAFCADTADTATVLLAVAALAPGSRTLGRDFARSGSQTATAIQTPTAHFPGAR